MGDIDFDELDRAVNSLMNQASAEDQQEQDTASNAPIAAPSPAARTAIQSDDAIGDIDGVMDTAAEPVAAVVPPARKAVAPTAGRRTSARFMDVIPSAAGARPVPSRPEPTAAPSREGMSLQPVGVSEAPVRPDAVDDLPVANFSEEGAAPLSSPFLEGVEIDKRPLGAPAAVEEGEAPAFEETESTVTAEAQATYEGERLPSMNDTQSSPWSNEVEVDQPTTAPAPEVLQPELSPEVLAVESMPLDSTHASVDGVVAPSPQPVTPVSVSSGLAPQSVEPATAAEESPATARPSAPSLATGDINPQYASTPTDAPEPSAVFDAASEVPGALSHPPKKKSGWSIVLWIVLMIIVGVAGGVAVWYFLVK